MGLTAEAVTEKDHVFVQTHQPRHNSEKQDQFLLLSCNAINKTWDSLPDKDFIGNDFLSEWAGNLLFTTLEDGDL